MRRSLKTIHVIYCDAEVQGRSASWGASERLLWNPKEAGGTDFCPASEWVEKNDVAPFCPYLSYGPCGAAPIRRFRNTRSCG